MVQVRGEFGILKQTASLTDYVIVLVSEELDVEPETITILSRFDEMDMDSLEFASLLQTIAEKFAPIPRDVAQKMETVGDLIRAIECDDLSN